MKILITDDNGATLYEKDDPGYIHLPDIFDGTYDVTCEEDDVS